MLFDEVQKNDAMDDEISEINIVPLVDVLLVLLVIFMITAPLAAYSLQVQLPKANIPAENTKSARLVVSVNRAGVVAVGSETLGKLENGRAREKFRSRVRRWKLRNPTGIALLRADERLSYGSVTQVMAELRRLRVEQMGLVIEQP